MEIVVCPNCGSKISVPKRKVSSIKCPKCNIDGLELGLDYFDENDSPRKSFLKRHKKEITAATLFVAWLAGKGLLFWLNNKNEPSSSPTIASDSSNESLTESSCEAVTESISENAMDISAYDAKTIEHPVSIRNLPENRFPSMEKVKQAHDMGIDLGLHQTIVDSYQQRHYTRKTE